MLLFLVFLLAAICAAFLASRFRQRFRHRRHLNRLRTALDYGSFDTHRKRGFIPHRS